MKSLNFKNILFLFILFVSFYSSMHAQKQTVTFNQLPNTAKEFISNHFKNEEVSFIIQEEEFYMIDEYQVKFTNGTKIEFNKKGEWKEVTNKIKPIKTTFIPNSILSYCTKSFPNTFINKIEKKRWSYEVKLSNGLELEFDSKGNFKRLDD